MPMKYRAAKIPVFILFLILILFVLPTKIVHGAVDIKSNQPLKDVMVMIIDTANVNRVMQSPDCSGVFFITGIKQDKFKANTYGYGHANTTIGPYNFTNHDKLNTLIKSEAVPVSLGEVGVNTTKTNQYLDSVQFYERRYQGLGYYVTWNDFKDRGLSNVYDIFRGIPGLIVNNNRVFFARYAVSSFRITEPKPSIYVDGMLINNSNIEWLSPESVQAVEVYNHLYAPIQYNRGMLGGVILIWTKN